MVARLPPQMSTSSKLGSMFEIASDLSLLSGIAPGSDSAFSVTMVCAVSMSSRYRATSSVPSSGFHSSNSPRIRTRFFVIYNPVIFKSITLNIRFFSLVIGIIIFHGQVELIRRT